MNDVIHTRINLSKNQDRKKKSYIILLIIALSLVIVMGCKKKKAAHYSFGKTVIEKKYHVDSKGGIFKIQNTRSPIFGLSVEIEPGTFRKKASFSLGYNDGDIHLVKGEAGGTVVTFQFSDDKIKFEKPVSIAIPCSSINYARGILGYSIENSGKLYPLDTIKKPEFPNTIYFLTFRSLIFTWVYTSP